MVDLKMYLTSLQPNMEQSIYSQSIGGYVSNSLLYPESIVGDTIGLYDTSFVLNSPTIGWGSWSNIEYININNEIIKINPIINGSVVADQRGINNIIEMHINGDIVRGISNIELFNDVFNDNYKQYRCIAVKNVSIEDPSISSIANNIFVYLKQNSRNSNSIIKIAIEKPQHQYIEGKSDTISSNSSTSSYKLIDSSLILKYRDDYFNNSYMRIKDGVNRGQGRIISSFESSTGIFYLDNPLLDDSGARYEILPSPAQRIKSGIISPILTASNITPFILAEKNNSLNFDFNENDNASDSSGILNINDVFYIWIERTIEKGSFIFDDNNIVINIEYTITG